MSLEQQVASLVAATSDLTNQVAGKMGQIDLRVEQKRAELDSWKAAARREFVFPVNIRYGNVDHNKAELLGNDMAKVSADETVSKWVLVGQNFDGKAKGYFVEGNLVIVHLDRAVSAPPGYPLYLTDWSTTYMQFVIANESATSDAIDARLGALGITPDFVGVWSNNADSIRTTAVRVPGEHPYSQLFVRYVNRNTYDPQKRKPQNILNFGGAGLFAIDHVAAYSFPFGGA